jgi:hypothetical protein
MFLYLKINIYKEAIMPAINYVKKKIGQNYLVWFQNSNLYTQLEEPAWFVFRKTVKRYKAETIAMECSHRYGLRFNECLRFVNDIRSNMVQMNQSEEDLVQDEKDTLELKTKRFEIYSTRSYQLTENIIEFSFENEWFESLIHPLIGYLETNKTNGKVSRFELFSHKGKSVFRLNNEIKGIWARNETHRLIGFIYMSIINEVYNKSADFWLMTVHAAAVTNGRKTILIPAESGSGKTTMAAMLQKEGYQLISDDFVPIDRHRFCAWPFPIALSVKQGSMDVLASIYPDLQNEPVKLTSTKKNVRYLTPNYIPEISDLIFPITEVVSIKYNPEVEFEFKKADQLKAIKLMLDQSWILPLAGNAGIFLDKVTQWSFYELTYSNNEKAIDAISKLFGND